MPLLARPGASPAALARVSDFLTLTTMVGVRKSENDVHNHGSIVVVEDAHQGVVVEGGRLGNCLLCLSLLCVASIKQD